METRAVTAWLVIAALGGLGCSSKTDEMKRQFDQMGREITALRANNIALLDRVEALEEASMVATSAQADDASARPALQVVRLVPEADEEPKFAVEDDGPRPVVVVHGDDARIDEPQE